VYGGRHIGGEPVAIQIEDFDAGSGVPLAGQWHGGDRAAFQAAYDSYHDRIFRFCRYRLGDAHEAEDVTQEAFARAWKSRTVLFEQERLYPWLRVVAGNLCTDVLRRRGRCQAVPEVDLGSHEETESSVIAASDAQTIRLAMSRLNRRHREALEQREDAGWTYEQIAQHSGTTVSSVESLLWRARQALKREFLAVAGRDGLLAGLPVIGLAVRSLHRTKERLARWGSFPSLPASLFANSMAASLIGSAAAAVVSVTVGVLAPAQVAPRPLGTVPVASTVTLPSEPSSPAFTASTSPSSNSPVPNQIPGVGSVNQPVYTAPANQSGDRAMPVHVGVGKGGGGDTVGVDPTAPPRWAVAFTKNHVINKLQKGSSR
jgi:RNA polymerase sigma factor (sigma-70 family)